MVVGLVLEHEDPVLLLAVYIHLDLYRAGIDLLALVKVGKLSVSLQLLCCKGGEVHKGHGLVRSAQLLADVHIHIVCILYVRSIYLYVFNICEECGVTAVIRPVGVDHAYLGYGGVALFLIAEVILTELDIVVVHGKSELVNECMESESVEVDEALKLLNCCGDIIVCIKSLYSLQ